MDQKSQELYFEENRQALLDLNAGVGSASGALQADANMTGLSSGVATVLGVLAARADMIGSASGVGAASGVPAVIVPTIGTAEVGTGGTTVVKKPIYLFGD